MIEKHYAYKIVKESSGLVCTQSEFEEDKMIDLLKEVKSSNYKGIYWVFKQSNGKAQEALCIIDCGYNRIYFHYSGDVETIDETINKLAQ